jgi:hypothetical protein
MIASVVPQLSQSMAMAHPTSTALTYLPVPFGGASVLATAAASAPSCTATLNAFSSISCGRNALWEKTTTVPYLIPCLGCTALATSYGYGGCPMGGGAPPQTTIPSTLTVFIPTCSPTPDPSSGHRPPPLTDTARSLPLPSLPSWWHDPFTPHDLSVTTYAEGWCGVKLGLYPSYATKTFTEYGSAYDAYQDSITSSVCATSTAYPGTASALLNIGCGGCTPISNRLYASEYNTVYCGNVWSETSVATVTATGPTTTWSYACAETGS